VGWEIEDIASGPRREARVRFEHPDGDDRVEVVAACSGGAPRFSLDDDGGSDDGDDGGGDDGDDGGGDDGDNGGGDDDSSSGADERERDEERD